MITMIAKDYVNIRNNVKLTCVTAFEQTEVKIFSFMKDIHKLHS